MRWAASPEISSNAVLRVELILQRPSVFSIALNMTKKKKKKKKFDISQGLERSRGARNMAASVGAEWAPFCRSLMYMLR